jgi:hypothetical protein
MNAIAVIASPMVADACVGDACSFHEDAVWWLTLALYLHVLVFPTILAGPIGDLFGLGNVVSLLLTGRQPAAQGRPSARSIGSTWIQALMKWLVVVFILAAAIALAWAVCLALVETARIVRRACRLISVRAPSRAVARRLVPPRLPTADDECIVCLCPLVGRVGAAVGPQGAPMVHCQFGCGKAFHNHCISKWLQYRPKCPHCSTDW